MEINEENIAKLAEILKTKDFEKALGKVQDYSKIAQQLMEQYPELTAEELGQKYEEQVMQAEQENGQNKDDSMDRED